MHAYFTILLSLFIIWKLGWIKKSRPRLFFFFPPAVYAIKLMLKSMRIGANPCRTLGHGVLRIIIGRGQLNEVPALGTTDLWPGWVNVTALYMQQVGKRYGLTSQATWKKTTYCLPNINSSVSSSQRTLSARDLRFPSCLLSLLKAK